MRLLLPPNLAAAAARDAVAIKLEFDPAAPIPEECLPGLALLSQWNGGASAAGPVSAFLQLDRKKLRQLLSSMRGQPVFRWVQRPDSPLAWEGDRLPGVTEHLAEPEPAPAAEPPLRPAPPPKSALRTTPMTVDGSEHFLAVALPSREDPGYRAAADLLKSGGFIVEPSNGKWWLRDRHKTLTFLARNGARLRDEFGARFTENFTRHAARVRPAEIVCEAEPSKGGFELAIGLRAGAAPESAVREAVAAGRDYVETEEGVYLIDPAQVARLDRAQRALLGAEAPVGPVRKRRIGVEEEAEAEDILGELAPGFRPPAEWRERTAALRNLSKLSPAPLPAELDAVLRLYQRLGVAWLWHLHRLGLGGILADEMGLGKTLQALALLAAVRADPGTAAPSLVVCPASLLENWRRESEKFTPFLRTVVHHGESRLGGAAAFAGWDLVITSYGTLARDRELFAGVEFSAVVGDEAQHAKNRRSQNAQALRSLRARGRFLLTGTPVENSLDDLRSHFEFLLPGYVERARPGTRREERAWLDERLRAKAAPYLLRRTKRVVAPELPEKIEQVVWCELGPAQAALYRTIQERTERELIDLAASGAGEGRLRLAALTQLLRLRQVCCDPRLVDGSSEPAPFSGSAKLEAWRELIEEAVDDGHRVLVFSQFTSLLSLLRAELEEQGTDHASLDGSMPVAARQAEVDRFQAPGGPPVFLLSLKAGGAGLNLTAADTVIHFDPWWNPAVEAQATDRAHRIGQSRVVTSYKLVCSGTVEERVLGLQAEKRALLSDVFEASEAEASRLSLDDLRALLAPASPLRPPPTGR
jgi:superfamily II DNA or RNA helicase